MNTTKESPQGTNRKTAAIVGVLFIIGTVSGVIGCRYWKTYPGCSGLSDADFCK